MRNEVIKLIAERESSKDKKLYKELLDRYAKDASVRKVHYYQLGYTPGKLNALVDEVQRHFYITKKDIALERHKSKKEADDDLGIDDELLKKQLAIQTPIQDFVEKMPEEVKEGLKIREEYEFLNDPNTPDVYKVLIADKITAYKEYAKAHAELLEAADESEAEEKLYQLAAEAVKKFALNQEIKAELDFYRDSGKVLGNHPKLAELKMQQDVSEMSEAELVKNRTNAQKSISKYEREGKKDLLSKWTAKLAMIEARLVKEFKYAIENGEIKK